MRADAAEHDPERLCERRELAAPFADPGRRLGERLAAPRADLDLGGDQLADDVLLDLGAFRGGLQLLEAVVQLERDRVEDGELLLDGQREVGAGVVPLARLHEQLLPGDGLRFTH